MTGHAAGVQVGSILGNSEIRLVSPMLVRSLKGGAEQVELAVRSLLNLDIRSRLDDASISIVLPILTRVIVSHQFSASMRMHSAAMVGAIATVLWDQSISKGSYTAVISLLQRALMDVDPGVREIAAKAVGQAYDRGPDRTLTAPLLNWLLSVLNSREATWAEKSGSAQALACICARLPGGRVETILKTAQVSVSRDAANKNENCYGSSGEDLGCRSPPDAAGASLDSCDPRAPSRTAGLADTILSHSNETMDSESCGGLQLISALAAAGQHQQLLYRTLPFIIERFASQSEVAREAALSAGRAVIRNATLDLDGDQYSPLHLLGRELLHSNWRSRLGSLLLFGTAVQQGLATNPRKASNSLEIELEQQIGAEPTQVYFAAIYLLRSEPVEEVAEAADSVWKSTVANTPRLLRRIMPRLMNMILTDLRLVDTAHERDSKRVRALRCIDLVSTKVAEYDGNGARQHVLPPLLKCVTGGDNPSVRGCLQGIVCVLSSASKQQLSMYLEQVIPTMAELLNDHKFTDSQVQHYALGLIRYLKRSDGCLASFANKLLQLWDKSDPFPPGLAFLLKHEGFSLFPVILSFTKSLASIQAAALILESFQFLVPEARKAIGDTPMESALISLGRGASSSLETVPLAELDALQVAAASYANAMKNASSDLDCQVILDSLLAKVKFIDLGKNLETESASLYGAVQSLVIMEVCRCYLRQLESESISLKRVQIVESFSRFVWRPEGRLQTIAVQVLLIATRAASSGEQISAARDLVGYLERSQPTYGSYSKGKVDIYKSVTLQAPCIAISELVPVFVSALNTMDLDDSDINNIDSRAEIAVLLDSFIHLFPFSCFPPKAVLIVAGALVRYLTEDGQMRARLMAKNVRDDAGRLLSGKGRSHSLRSLFDLLGSSSGTSCRVLAPQLLTTLVRCMQDSDKEVRQLGRDAAERLISLRWLKSESVVKQVLAILEANKDGIEILPSDVVASLLGLLHGVLNTSGCDKELYGKGSRGSTDIENVVKHLQALLECDLSESTKRLSRSLLGTLANHDLE